MRESMKKNAVAHLVMTMWQNAEGKRLWVVIYSTLAALAILVELCRPLILAELMNAVQSLRGDALIERSAWLLAAFIGLSILFWVLHGPSRVMEVITAFIVKRTRQTGLFGKVTLLPTRWHRDNHSGEIIDQNEKASQAIGEFSESGFQVIHIFVQFIGATAMLTYVMPLAGLTIGVATTIAIGVVMLFDRVLIGRYDYQNRRFNEVAASIQDYLTNISTVISLRLEHRVSEEVKHRIDKILPYWKKTSILNELKWFCTALVVNGTRAAVIMAYIIIMVKRGDLIEIGTMYALIQYLNKVGESFFEFTWLYGELVVKSTRVHATDYIEESFEREVSELPSATLPSTWREISIEDLSYSHDDEISDEQSSALDNISLSLERGKKYAFVGKSGCGKSTTLGLIRGINTTEDVNVYCDGELLEHGLKQVAHHCTLIPQEPEIFSDSIRFNVNLGIEATEQSIERAIQLAHFEEALAKLPRGLATNIAEKGVNLSGGEKQRLALARGLFFAEESNSDIILLDEPASSLDEPTALSVYEGILDYFADRCIVAALHKPKLLKLFDEIIVFSQGKIVRRGTPGELLAGGELYAEQEAEVLHS